MADAIFVQWSQLRQGPAGALKTMLLEGQVFPGLASTAFLSAESEKSDKGLPSNSRKSEPAQSAAPPTAPAEPFDTTTYKNLQHHDCTVYTFLDVNLDLSKQRLLQPSSGTESPHH
ncbi:NADH dehydrogenase [ubiquinone] flavoprotein 3, mitochondrial-like [Myotis daubentonii]|uniref:NADH dehydrogenase [ubiquinone] flavoprotein 3, mitochondrial-like n=1 Tax=Myotis daubentonii TaxID=98922 RepID=UPI002873B59D|nr:NADH dehydrogenase [ubiquinone] flavoprotein 3, mitochondrial-like [Myotis daubentonii]